tara:strand:- start:2023 stop:2220 length:198 start_codon:yes stop_codon:yes gene_type:complete
MFCLNCYGLGIINGPGFYRGICSLCKGFGREIIVSLRKESLGEIDINATKKTQGDAMREFNTEAS